jgi:hypothetical protein
MNKNVGWLIAVVLGITGVYLLVPNKKAYLAKWMDRQADQPDSKALFKQLLDKFTEAELDAVYAFVHDYVEQNKMLPPTSTLGLQLQAISFKYNIFT